VTERLTVIEQVSVIELFTAIELVAAIEVVTDGLSPSRYVALLPVVVRPIARVLARARPARAVRAPALFHFSQTN
jgi:hypothetical protein